MSTDIQDTGEKLGGAVKDDWANYQRKQEEEAAKTSVAALWPKPDWKALIAEIAENPEHTAETARQLAATLYVVRDLAIDHQQRSGAFTRGPVRYKDETIPALKVRFLSELQSHLLSCFFDPELGSITGAVLSFAHYLAEGGIPYEDRIDEDIRDPAEAYPKALAILKVAMRDPYVPMARGYRHPPYKPGREQLQQRVMEWSATLTAMVRNLLHDGWPDVMPTRGRGRRQLPPMPQRPRLERLERTGPEHRTGDVRPEAIIETLGIRGVEFGNWVDGGERQANVNLAFDALHDLVEVLGIKPADIGRGRLGIGFGSRGRGSSGGMAIAAHYEPSRVVINLTRFAGDGSLAHEMGHMFEHGLAGFEFIPEDGPTGRRKKTHRSFPSTSWRGLWKTPERPALLDAPALDAAFWHLLDTIMKADPEQPAPWKSSGYLQQANRLGGYWSAPLELFARAFECYAFDWLKERGRVSQYLVHGVEGDRFATGFRGNPYPTGDDRQHINAAMASLIKVWRETLF